MESAANGITLTDRRGIVTWVNSAFTKISGFSRSKIVGEKAGIMSSGFHDKEFFQDLLKTISAGFIWSGEIVNRRPDGTLYTVEETIAPIQDASGEISHFVSILQDITERKKAENIIREHAELLQREINLAAEVQSSLLPRASPTLNGYGVAAAAIPAQYVSGDLYDYFPVGHDKCFFTVADISGKGVPAAMLSSSLKTLVRSFPEMHNDPVALLQRMNRLLFNELSNAGMFITLFAACLDISLGVLQYASAGHTQGILVRGHDNSFELLPSTGLPLGIEPESDYTGGVTHLAPGDAFVIYSDGITEAHNAREELFGLDRLNRILLENRTEDSECMIKKVNEAVSDFRGETPLSDDISIIILKGKDRTIPFSFNADIENLEEMNALVRTACTPYGEEFSYEMELSASEIFTNVIRHSYRDTTGMLRGILTMTQEEVTLDVYDNAEAFDIASVTECDEGLPKEGGYGLPILRKLCDQLEYTPGESEGNHWHAVKGRKKR